MRSLEVVGWMERSETHHRGDFARNDGEDLFGLQADVTTLE